jgi:ketosteroid isomerase-like protein
MAAAILACAVQAFAANAPSTVAAVHAADDSWVKAYNAGNLDAVVSLYDDAAVIYPPGTAPARGSSAIRAYFAKDNAEFLRAGLIFSLDAKADGGVTGDTGWSSGTYKVKDKAGRLVDAGWYFSVSRKVAGRWLYVRDAWNSAGPPAQTTLAPEKP